MPETIFLLSPENKNSLGTIRCTPGIQAAETPEHIYLRVKNGDDAIRQLPATHTYRLDEQERLFPINGLTPIGKLPTLNWWPLPDFLRIEMPVAALPGKFIGKLPFRLIPAEAPQESYAMLTTLEQWKTWADTAPAVRLAQLQFAVSATNEVLITGQPLPTLPGKELWMQNGILMPAGYAFEVAILPEIIAVELNPDKDSLLLFDTEANWQTIPLNAFVPATRSAVRLTEFVK